MGRADSAASVTWWPWAYLSPCRRTWRRTRPAVGGEPSGHVAAAHGPDAPVPRLPAGPRWHPSGDDAPGCRRSAAAPLFAAELGHAPPDCSPACPSDIVRRHRLFSSAFGRGARTFWCLCTTGRREGCASALQRSLTRSWALRAAPEVGRRAEGRGGKGRGGPRPRAGHSGRGRVVRPPQPICWP